MQERKAGSADLEQAGGQSLLQYRVLFRVLALFHHLTISIIVLSFDASQTKIPEIISMKKYLSRYLTLWNFSMQIAYLVLGLQCDFLEWRRRDKGKVARKLVSFRKFFFSSLVFPSSLFVIIFFWSVWRLDRELILPKATEQFITPCINHSIHTFVVMVVLLDVLLQPGKRPLNDLKNKMTLLFYCVIYLITLFCTYLEAGLWIYPMFSYLNISQYIMFCLFIVPIILVCYELQWPLTRLARKLRSIKSQ